MTRLRDRNKTNHGGAAHNRVRARIVFYFADGSLKVKGVFGPTDHQLNIVGGTGRWNGAGGKVKLHNAGHGAERYTFTVVQS
jgi:hypothetical protein